MPAIGMYYGFEVCVRDADETRMKEVQTARILG